MAEGFWTGLAVLVGGWGGLCALAALGSGWLSWSRAYRCAERPLEGDVLAVFAFALRPPIFLFPYPYAVRVGASAMGLHLRTNITVPFLHGRLRIPWSDVRVERRKLLFLEIVGFEFAGVEGPRLFVWPGAFAALRRKARLYWDPASGPLHEVPQATTGPAPSASGPGEAAVGARPEAPLSPYMGPGTPLTLPEDGGTIGPARVDEVGGPLQGMPARLAAGALAAGLAVALLNWIGVFGAGDGHRPGPDPQVEIAEAGPAAAAPVATADGHSPADAVAANAEPGDAGCPPGTFRMGDRYPIGRELYCMHATEAVRHGPFVAWYDNGMRKAEGVYRMGKRHGRWVRYDEQGRTRVEAGFADDRKHGLLRVFAEDGSVESESRWDHGRRTG